MAVRRHSNFDKTVQTIADRNAISVKVDGMMVTVLDSIADPDAGGGKAIYRWVGADSSWAVVYKSVYRTMSFATEELSIINGEVIATNIPANDKLWDVQVVEGDIAVAYPRIEDLTISVGVIGGLETFNGKKLRFTYGYGSVTQQLNSVLAVKADAEDVYTKEEVDAALSNVSAGSVDFSGITNKPTTLTGYDIADAYTKTEVDTALASKLDSETITTLSKVGNELRYVNEAGTTQAIDLSLYIDDTNLARIVSGTYDSNTNSLVFTRDDASTFSIDASMFFDDTNLVTSVAGKTGVVTLAKGDVGLGSVDNTADANKPISTATQTALDGKVDKVTGKGLSTEDYTSAEKTKLAGIAAGAQVNTVTSVVGKTGVVTLAKGDVGLGNVDNTSDVNKPISTATQTALNAKQASLVSGTTIKTINGTSVLGSGDITIEASATMPDFYECSKVINYDYTVPLDKNAMIVGPITVADGFNINVSEGSRLVIL